MSMGDKFSSGAAVILIQHFTPAEGIVCLECRDYYRDIIFFVCGLSGLLGAAAMMSVFKKDLGERRQEKVAKSEVAK